MRGVLSFVLHDRVNILRDRDKFQDIRAISYVSAVLSHVLYAVPSRQKARKRDAAESVLAG